MNVRFYSEELVLLPEKAVYWPAQDSLFVADLHLGKDDHFRAHGIAAPAGSDAITFSKLRDLLEAFATSNLYVLGDVFHGSCSVGSALGPSLASFSAKYEERCCFIAGNHDRHVRGLQTGIKFESPKMLAGLRLAHHPTAREEQPTLCGHVHPGVRLSVGRARGASAPAFVKQGCNLILPSFGAFTGLATFSPTEIDWAVAVCDGKLVSINAPLEDGTFRR